MDTISVDTSRVEFTIWLLIRSVEPIAVEKLKNCEMVVDIFNIGAFNVNTVSVKFTVWLLTVRVDPNPVEKLLNCE